MRLILRITKTANDHTRSKCVRFQVQSISIGRIQFQAGEILGKVLGRLIRISLLVLSIISCWKYSPAWTIEYTRMSRRIVKHQIVMKIKLFDLFIGGKLQLKIPRLLWYPFPPCSSKAIPSLRASNPHLCEDLSVDRIRFFARTVHRSTRLSKLVPNCGNKSV